MKPILTYRPLSDFPRRKHKELCTCGVPCANVVLIVRNEFAYQVCEKGTAAFAYELLKVAGQISEPLKSPGSVWTILETMELRDYVLGFQGKLPYGALTAFGKKLGKNRDQVKNRITYLKRIGELPYLNPRK